MKYRYSKAEISQSKNYEFFRNLKMPINYINLIIIVICKLQHNLETYYLTLLSS